ncbi:hypothetical protein QBC39DRAFT_342353 [Podospora conica]|nr:hypothetical protein QBC39DRAFT_342353 [Schizothecium conicum]
MGMVIVVTVTMVVVSPWRRKSRLAGLLVRARAAVDGKGRGRKSRLPGWHEIPRANGLAGVGKEGGWRCWRVD